MRCSRTSILEYFDGMSIGSNDMTQLTLGLDRDSGVIAHLFDERDPAVKAMMSMAIRPAARPASMPASAARARRIIRIWRNGWSIRASNRCR